jgi:hypothetical protein
MKKFTILVCLLFLALAAVSQDYSYSRVKIYTDAGGLRQLQSMGLPVDDSEVRPGAWIITELSREELSVIEAAGFHFEVLVEDLKSFYRERNKPLMERLDQLVRADYELSMEWPVPDGFELGSVGGFCSIDQMQAHIDNMIATYPELISPKYYLPQLTHEGRQIVWLKISDNPVVDEAEPEVLYTGMHHAREPIGMQVQLFYMYYLLENYDTDPEIQYIVDNFELYFIPIVNMDGYAYNILTDPYGGGMWRKNRRDNGDGSFGVDINRNYGYMWGIDDEGSSPYTWDETYRGPYAFSEPCIQAVRDFCVGHEFRIALNYHSYSNLLLYAWGYTGDLAPDDEIMREYGRIMTRENFYTYGPGYSTIYATNGGSDDWMYGEQSIKEKIFAYTPEVGNSQDGFWPSADRIIPQCQENMWQNLMAARLCGPYATVTDASPDIIETTAGQFEFGITRLGLDETGTYTVSVTPLNDAIAEIGDPVIFSGMELLETRPGAFDFILGEDIQSGDEILYLLSVYNGYFTESDTVSKIFGTPVVIFEDTASTMEHWTSPKWSTTTFQYHSPERSITDSPFGDYNSYENNILTLSGSIDLTGATYAVLNFWAKWDIEAGYDYVQVLASRDNGSTWAPLSGEYTHAGNGYQQEGEPLYDGIQQDWVREEISLGDFLGYPVRLRFVLVSDSYIEGDGFYWDDMTVTVLDNTIGIRERIPGNPPWVSSPYPNPAGGFLQFELRSEEEFGLLTLSIYDVTGGKVFQEVIAEGADRISISAGQLPGGVYFYTFAGDGSVVASGKFIVRH